MTLFCRCGHVIKVCGLSTTFAEVTGEWQVGGLFGPASWIGLIMGPHRGSHYQIKLENCVEEAPFINTGNKLHQVIFSNILHLYFISINTRWHSEHPLRKTNMTQNNYVFPGAKTDDQKKVQYKDWQTQLLPPTHF